MDVLPIDYRAAAYCSPQIIEPEGAYFGAIEEVRYSAIRGWAINRKNPDEHVRLTLRIDGHNCGYGVTGEGHAGNRFSFELPAPTEIIGLNSVEVVLQDERGFPAWTLIWGESGRPLPPAWQADTNFRFPSFFVLGAAKSATTSLHVYLDQHPEVFMSKPKEPFFFEAEHERGGQYYFAKYFAGWQGQRAVGASRHRNLYLPYVPERIHAFNPHASLIAVLRHPAERAVSHWWHWRSRALEPLPLEAALQADLERIQAGERICTSAEITRYVASLGKDGRGCHRTYLDSGYYYEQLQRYISLFGRSRLHVVLYEDLVNSPETTTADIFAFLGLDPACAEKIDYSPLNRSAAGMLEHVDAALETWLIDHYRSHNEALEALLGRSLAAWSKPFRRVAGAL